MLVTNREIAKKIPIRLIETLLLENVIFKAIAVPHDPHMKVLFGTWTTYIDTSGSEDETCTFCLARILKNFQNLQDTFTEIIKEQNLLKL